MNRRIRYLAGFLVACFVVLFIQLNNLQVRQSSALSNSPHTPAGTDISARPRGDIVSSDGVILANSTPTKDGYGQQRHYPEGPLFAGITGAYDIAENANAFGIEAQYNNYLIQHQSQSRTLDDLLTEHAGTDTVALTVSSHLQTVAQSALAGRIGAVVAIDPRTGAILAMYANPTYDPNKLAVHNQSAVLQYYNSLNPNSGNSPLVNGATQQIYSPGSTFKVITTTAIFEHQPALAQKVFPNQSAIGLPQTNLKLHNFNSEVCGGDLPTIISQSCDTAYAQLGLLLGAQTVSEQANAFGFNKRPPLDLPSFEVSKSYFPPASYFPQRLPILAYSSIGQENVQESALQNALVVAGIAHNGVIMSPHLLSKVIDDQGRVVSTYTPTPWITAASSESANEVRNLMLGVVSLPRGTAHGLFPASLNVAAKTGTAETATSCANTWLVATAPAGANDIPKVAVAAVVPAQAGVACGSEATGAAIAGPVVQKVLEAALRK